MASLVLALALSVGASLAQAAEIILYDYTNFGGQSESYSQSTANLGNFDNKASSVRVISGTWRLYRDANYRSYNGPSVLLGPGDYTNLGNAGFKRNRLSAVRLMEDDVRTSICGEGTRAGPGGQCQCRRDFVATGQDSQGRLVCGPASVAGQGSLKPPPRIPGRVPPGTARLCTGPYRIVVGRRCMWRCGRNSRPNVARNRCSCNRGYVGRGTDRRGRVRCVVGRGTVPRPAASKIYWVAGNKAIALAQRNGFTFSVSMKSLPIPYGSWCEMRGASFIAHYRPTGGVGSLFEATCYATLFAGRELAAGWSFGRFEWYRATGLTFRFGKNANSLGYHVSFTARRLGRAETVTLNSLALRGPVGRRWDEAFR